MMCASLNNETFKQLTMTTSMTDTEVVLFNGPYSPEEVLFWVPCMESKTLLLLSVDAEYFTGYYPRLLQCYAQFGCERF